MARLLIIGYGNPLRGDDGIGWHVAQRLSGQLCSADVQVVACHQLTPDLAEDISRAERVVFIDAARNLPAGEIHCEPVLPETPGAGLTPASYSHHFSAPVLLNVCRELYGPIPPAFLISVGGKDFSEGAVLSPCLSKMVEEVIALVQKVISKGDCNIS